MLVRFREKFERGKINDEKSFKENRGIFRTKYQRKFGRKSRKFQGNSEKISENVKIILGNFPKKFRET